MVLVKISATKTNLGRYPILGKLGVMHDLH